MSLELIKWQRLGLTRIKGLSRRSGVQCCLLLGDNFYFGGNDPAKLVKCRVDENGLIVFVSSYYFVEEIIRICKFGDDILVQDGYCKVFLFNRTTGKHRFLIETENNISSLNFRDNLIYIGTEECEVLVYGSDGKLQWSFKCGLRPQRLFVMDDCIAVSEESPWRSKVFSSDKSLGLVMRFEKEQLIFIDSKYLYLAHKRKLTIRENKAPESEFNAVSKEIDKIEMPDWPKCILQLDDDILYVRCDDSAYLLRFDGSKIEILNSLERQPYFQDNQSSHLFYRPGWGTIILESVCEEVGSIMIAFGPRDYETGNDVPSFSSLICREAIPPPEDLPKVCSIKLYCTRDFTCLAEAINLRKIDVRDCGLNEQEMGSLCSVAENLPWLNELLVDGNDFNVNLVGFKSRKKFRLDIYINVITRKGSYEDLVKLKNCHLVVLLGHSGAGKTVLSDYIKSGSLQSPTDHESTPSIHSIGLTRTGLFGKTVPPIRVFPGHIQSLIANRFFLSNPYYVPVLVGDLSIPYGELLACELFWLRLLACASESQYGKNKRRKSKRDKTLQILPEIILVGTHMDLCKGDAMAKMQRLKKDLEEFSALHHPQLKFSSELFPICSVNVAFVPSANRLDDFRKYLSIKAVQETRIPIDLSNAQYRFRKSENGTRLFLSKTEFTNLVFFNEKMPEPELLDDILQLLTSTGDIIFAKKDFEDNILIDPTKFGKIVSMFVAPVEIRSESSLVFAQSVRDNKGKASYDSVLSELLGSAEVTLEELKFVIRLVDKMGIIYDRGDHIICPALMSEPNNLGFSVELDRFCYDQLGIRRFCFGQSVSCGERRSVIRNEKDEEEDSLLDQAADVVKLKLDSTGAICFPAGAFEEFAKSVIGDDFRLYKNVVVFSKNDCVVVLQLESFYMRHIYIVCYSKTLEKAIEETNRLREKLETICGEKSVFSGCICPTCIDLSPLQSSDSFQRCCNLEDNLQIPKRCDFLGHDVIPLKFPPSEDDVLGPSDLKTTLGFSSVSNSMVNIFNSCWSYIEKLGLVMSVPEVIPDLTSAYAAVKLAIDRTELQVTCITSLLSGKNGGRFDELKVLVSGIQEYLKTSKGDMEGYLDKDYIVSRRYIQSLCYLYLHLSEVYDLVKRFSGESKIPGKTWLQLMNDSDWLELFSKKIWTVGFRSFGCEFFESEMERLCGNLRESAADFKLWATKEGLGCIERQID